MVKRVIWSGNADRIFTKILEFYIERNGSKAYSRRLNNEILSLITILSKQPFLGIKTDKKDIRILIKSHFKIFYQIDNDILIIHLIWDYRQSQESLNMLSK